MSHLLQHDHDHNPPDHEHRHAHHDEHGDDQSRAHDNGGSSWSGFTHWLSEMIGGHSHDTADQIDDALEADSAGRRAW